MSDRRPRSPLFVAGGALLLLGLLAAGVIANLERVERTRFTPPSGEALTNPLLAAERMLSRMGVEARSTRRLDELPPVDHVIVLAAEQRLLTPSRADRLLDWVSQGGFLIVGPYLERGRVTAATWTDLLLERLEVGIEELDVGDERESREVVAMEAPIGEGTLDVEFFSEFGLTLPEEPPEEAGIYALIWVDVDDGIVAVLNDLQFARSTEIGKHAHASFLWELVRSMETTRGALLVYGWDTSSTWGKLIRVAWIALLLAAMLLALWSWRNATRFGPMIPSVERGSRSLLEHVDALGHFLWRAQRADTLVSAARRALEQRILARRPELASLEPGERVQGLARRSSLDERTVRSAMQGRTPRGREEFTRTIRTLERLRRSL